MHILYRIFTHRTTYHVLFWLLYTTLILALNAGREGLWLNLSNALLHSLFLAALVYFNQFYLIPNYLSQKRFLLYSAWLVFSVLLVTPLELFCLFQNLRHHPYAQADLLQNIEAHAVFMLVVLVLTTVFNIGEDWLIQQRVQRDLERRTLQSELAFLKSQINPHFLFNTLNNLYALSLKKSDKAPEVILHLSEMMRYMLYECNHKTVPLEREVQHLKDYLELERVRYGDKALIEMHYSGDRTDYQIAPLLFIPFLENAFKHGLSHQLAGGYVHILLRAEQGRVDFSIENSKAGLREARYFQGGIGLKNVQRRLELLYPNRHELHIEQTQDVYSVTLHIALEGLGSNT